MKRAHGRRLAARVLLVVALLGPAAHVMELPGKLRLPPETWLVVQQTLYGAFAPVGALGYLGAPIACAMLARAVRGTAEARLAWIAAALVLAALAIWAVVVAPVNGLIAAATPATLPPHWTAWRLRWEAGHAAGCFLVAVALLLMLRYSSNRDRTSAARSNGQA